MYIFGIGNMVQVPLTFSKSTTGNIVVPDQHNKNNLIVGPLWDLTPEWLITIRQIKEE